MAKKNPNNQEGAGRIGFIAEDNIMIAMGGVVRFKRPDIPERLLWAHNLFQDREPVHLGNFQAQAHDYRSVLDKRARYPPA